YHGFDEAGLGNETSRWGDYSATSVDPSDPNRFWAIQMYDSGSQFDLWSVWSTQITELITTPQLLLAIKPTGTNVMLSWPSGFPSYHLQFATNLASPVVWSNISQSPLTNGNQLFIALPISAGKQFFRLQQ